MPIQFTNTDNETDGGALELDGASFVTSADVGGVTYVFVAGAADNGISVFVLGLDGTLTNVANVTDGGALNLAGVCGLTTVTANGNTYLVAAGRVDNGLSVFRVGVNGGLTNVDNVVDGGALTLGGAARVTSAVVGGVSYVFASAEDDDGISVFRMAGDGRLSWVTSFVDNGATELNGVKGLTTAVIGGNTFLFAAGGVDDGVSVFFVNSSGLLTHTHSVTDAGALELDGASEVATAVVGGVTYLFVTGTADSGVSVFSVNSSGLLTNTFNLADTAGLRLGSASGLAVSVFGTTTYLTVGGGEDGVSVFRVNPGGSLTTMDNIDDGGARELSGLGMLHTASVGGRNYVLGVGSADDGVSVFGLRPSGQLWFTTDGGNGDTRIVRINNDGSSQTVNIDNSPIPDPLPSSFQTDVGLDTAAGFYFGLSTSGIGDNAFLTRGQIGSSAAPAIVVDFPDAILVNGIQVDAINHKIYVGYQDSSGSAPASTGIRIYAYNPLNGAVTDQGFLTTAATDNRGLESGFQVLDPRDFALDSSIGRLFYTELLAGGAVSVGLFRLDLTTPNVAVQLVSQAQFPDNGTNGYIHDVEVDQATDLVYFSTQSQAPSPGAGYNAAQNAIWYISENATSGTAVKVTLAGAVGANFYPGDMTFDQNLRQLYVESEESASGSADDVIYVFQLDTAGTTATLINTFFPNPAFVSSGANIQGMTFANVATLGALNGTAAQVAEQGGSATVLLTGAPTITDIDGDHLAGATVQVTGGRFSSNESSAADDHLGYGSARQISGLIVGTNIALSWNASTETLTLTGYDTQANYRAVLAGIVFWSTGDNPTNSGLNPTRTLTWIINDGTPDIPGGGINSGVTTLVIAAVNDAPVNGVVSTASGSEDAAVSISGLQINDPDANAGLDVVTVTLSVQQGGLTLLTNVAGGLTAGSISGNGGVSVTVSGTLNQINATLAAVNGLRFAGPANFAGTETLTVTTNDGGGTGSGGARSDVDAYLITVNAANDPHTGGAGITGTATENQVLTAISTLADADGLGTLHYQWQHDVGFGYVNVGTDQATYTLGDGDVGGLVRVVISYIDGQGFAETATSASTASISNVNDAPTGGVSIVGSRTENQVLSADLSTLADADGVGTFHYQWQRDTGSGFVNVGADQATYTLSDADVGGTVRVVTSYVDQQGTVEAVVSAATAAIAGVNDPHTGGALILGTAAEDQVLTAVSTLADVDGLGTLHYQWQHDVGSGFVNVGTDQATYTLGDGDVSGLVRVVISYVDGQGFAESATSASTAVIVNVEDLPLAQNDAVSVVESGMVSGNVFANNGSGPDTDPDGPMLSVSAVNGSALNVGTTIVLPSGALMRLNANGTFSYNPNGAFDLLPDMGSGASNPTAQDSFTYTLSGGGTATVTVTIQGQDSDGDLLFGTSGADILAGGTGDDSVNALGGSDTLSGGAGVDQLSGGEGFDTAAYTFANGAVTASLAAGGASNDGDGASDTFTGIEALEGSAFNDSLTGSNVANVLVGAGGNDQLIGLDGDDILRGGAGVDVLNGGNGIDTVDYSTAAAGMRAQLNTNASTNDGDGGTDTFSGIENLTGSAFNDTLIGDGVANVLRGGTGADTLLGLGGADVLWGGSGALNTLQGGLGDDLYVLEAADSITELAGEGIDTVDARIAVYTLAANVENLVFGGVGSFTGTGNAGANTITGGTGDDNLRGRGGIDVLNGGQGIDTVDYTLAAAGVTARLDLMRATNDGDGATDTFTGIENLTGSNFNDLLIGDGNANVLMGGIGTDTLLGFGGDDILMGGSGGGNNQLQGGQGNDWYILDAFDTCVELVGEGIDTVEARIGSYTMGANIENLLYTGPGKFVGSGNALNNTITGAGQNDILKGGGGNDVINGGLGSDELQLRGTKAQYTVTVEGSGYRIVDSVVGRDGSTLVSSIEVLRFLTGNTTTALVYPPVMPAPLETAHKDAGPLVSPIMDDQPVVLPAVHDKVFEEGPLVLPGPEDGKMLLRELFALHGDLPAGPHALYIPPEPDFATTDSRDWM